MRKSLSRVIHPSHLHIKAFPTSSTFVSLCKHVLFNSFPSFFNFLRVTVTFVGRMVSVISKCINESLLHTGLLHKYRYMHGSWMRFRCYLFLWGFPCLRTCCALYVRITSNWFISPLDDTYKCFWSRKENGFSVDSCKQCREEGSPHSHWGWIRYTGKVIIDLHAVHAYFHMHIPNQFLFLLHRIHYFVSHQKSMASNQWQKGLTPEPWPCSPQHDLPPIW